MEKNVTSLEPSKKLKDLGVNQESRFYWVGYENPYSQIMNEGDCIGKDRMYLSYADDEHFGNQDYYISAFLSSELGELLRPYLGKNLWFSDEIGQVLQDVTYFKDECDNRAKMLIYLLEQKLIKL